MKLWSCLMSLDSVEILFEHAKTYKTSFLYWGYSFLSGFVFQFAHTQLQKYYAIWSAFNKIYFSK